MSLTFLDFPPSRNDWGQDDDDDDSDASSDDEANRPRPHGADEEQADDDKAENVQSRRRRPQEQQQQQRLVWTAAVGSPRTVLATVPLLIVGFATAGAAELLTACFASYITKAAPLDTLVIATTSASPAAQGIQRSTHANGAVLCSLYSVPALNALLAIAPEPIPVHLAWSFANELIARTCPRRVVALSGIPESEFRPARAGVAVPPPPLLCRMEASPRTATATATTHADSASPPLVLDFSTAVPQFLPSGNIVLGADAALLSRCSQHAIACTLLVSLESDAGLHSGETLAAFVPALRVLLAIQPAATAAAAAAATAPTKALSDMLPQPSPSAPGWSAAAFPPTDELFRSAVTLATKRVVATRMRSGSGVELFS